MFKVKKIKIKMVPGKKFRAQAFSGSDHNYVLESINDETITYYMEGFTVAEKEEASRKFFEYALRKGIIRWIR